MSVGVTPGPGTILITGAGRGLGRAMAVHLAAPGRLLLLHHNLSAHGAGETADLVRSRGAEAVCLAADLGDFDQREGLLRAAAEHAGELNLLINNASLFEERPLAETDPGHWGRVMEINCNAVQHLIHGALPLLRAGTPSQVINLGDSGADRVVARVEATAYHAAKLGVHLLTRSYAKLLGPDRIRVNMISPGFLENSVGDPASALPLGRKGSFGDVLGALDYLISDAADYVSGSNLVVSGAWNL